MTDEQMKAYIEALLEERKGHLRAGREDDANAVDAELKRVGYKAKSPAKRAVKMKPQGKVEL